MNLDEAIERVTEIGQEITLGKVGKHPISAETFVSILSAMQQAKAEIELWQAEHQTAVQKCITCGVAATHPDEAVWNGGMYVGEWNSPQAESVRKLRRERDTLTARLEAAEKVVEAAASASESLARTHDWISSHRHLDRLQAALSAHRAAKGGE